MKGESRSGGCGCFQLQVTSWQVKPKRDNREAAFPQAGIVITRATANRVRLVFQTTIEGYLRHGNEFRGTEGRRIRPESLCGMISN